MVCTKKGEAKWKRRGYIFTAATAKGKTTAAIGLSVRSCGRGWPVVLSQFLKGSTSGELNVLRNLPNYHYVEAPTTTCKFVFQMDDQEKMEYSQQVRQHFADTVEAVKKYHAKLLVMDEVLDAVAMGMLSDEALAEFLRNRPEDLEVVMTGRAPTPCTDPAGRLHHPYAEGPPPLRQGAQRPRRRGVLRRRAGRTLPLSLAFAALNSCYNWMVNKYPLFSPLH